MDSRRKKQFFAINKNVCSVDSKTEEFKPFKILYNAQVQLPFSSYYFLALPIIHFISTMTFYSSKLAKAFYFAVIAIVCSSNGSAGNSVDTATISKRLRGFDAMQVKSLVEYSNWKHEYSSNHKDIKPRMLAETCGQEQFDSQKQEAIDYLYKTERKVRYLRRAAFGSYTCKVGLKKAIKKVPKIAKLLSKNDFGRAWRKVKNVISEVRSCGAALDEVDGTVGDSQLKAASASLDKLFELILKARNCYYYLHSSDDESDSPIAAPASAPAVNLVSKYLPTFGH